MPSGPTGSTPDRKAEIDAYMDYIIHRNDPAPKPVKKKPAWNAALDPASRKLPRKVQEEMLRARAKDPAGASDFSQHPRPIPETPQGRVAQSMAQTFISSLRKPFAHITSHGADVLESIQNGRWQSGNSIKGLLGYTSSPLAVGGGLKPPNEPNTYDNPKYAEAYDTQQGAGTYYNDWLQEHDPKHKIPFVDNWAVKKVVGGGGDLIFDPGTYLIPGSSVLQGAGRKVGTRFLNAATEAAGREMVAAEGAGLIARAGQVGMDLAGADLTTLSQATIQQSILANEIKRQALYKTLEAQTRSRALQIATDIGTQGKGIVTDADVSFFFPGEQAGLAWRAPGTGPVGRKVGKLLGADIAEYKIPLLAKDTTNPIVKAVGFGPRAFGRSKVGNAFGNFFGGQYAPMIRAGFHSGVPDEVYRALATDMGASANRIGETVGMRMGHDAYPEMTKAFSQGAEVSTPPTFAQVVSFLLRKEFKGLGTAGEDALVGVVESADNALIDSTKGARPLADFFENAYKAAEAVGIKMGKATSYISRLLKKDVYDDLLREAQMRAEAAVPRSGKGGLETSLGGVARDPRVSIHHSRVTAAMIGLPEDATPAQVRQALTEHFAAKYPDGIFETSLRKIIANYVRQSDQAWGRQRMLDTLLGWGVAAKEEDAAIILEKMHQGNKGGAGRYFVDLLNKSKFPQYKQNKIMREYIRLADEADRVTQQQAAANAQFPSGGAGPTATNVPSAGTAPFSAGSGPQGSSAVNDLLGGPQGPEYNQRPPIGNDGEMGGPRRINMPKKRGTGPVGRGGVRPVRDGNGMPFTTESGVEYTEPAALERAHATYDERVARKRLLDAGGERVVSLLEDPKFVALTKTDLNAAHKQFSEFLGIKGVKQGTEEARAVLAVWENSLYEEAYNGLKGAKEDALSRLDQPYSERFWAKKYVDDLGEFQTAKLFRAASDPKLRVSYIAETRGVPLSDAEKMAIQDLTQEEWAYLSKVEWEDYPDYVDNIASQWQAWQMGDSKAESMFVDFADRSSTIDKLKGRFKDETGAARFPQKRPKYPEPGNVGARGSSETEAEYLQRVADTRPDKQVLDASGHPIEQTKPVATGPAEAAAAAEAGAKDAATDPIVRAVRNRTRNGWARSSEDLVISSERSRFVDTVRDRVTRELRTGKRDTLTPESIQEMWDEVNRLERVRKGVRSNIEDAPIGNRKLLRRLREARAAVEDDIKWVKKGLHGSVEPTPPTGPAFRTVAQDTTEAARIRAYYIEQPNPLQSYLTDSRSGVSRVDRSGMPSDQTYSSLDPRTGWRGEPKTVTQRKAAAAKYVNDLESYLHTGGLENQPSKPLIEVVQAEDEKALNKIHDLLGPDYGENGMKILETIRRMRELSRDMKNGVSLPTGQETLRPANWSLGEGLGYRRVMIPRTASDVAEHLRPIPFNQADADAAAAAGKHYLFDAPTGETMQQQMNRLNRKLHQLLGSKERVAQLAEAFDFSSTGDWGRLTAQYEETLRTLSAARSNLDRGNDAAGIFLGDPVNKPGNGNLFGTRPSDPHSAASMAESRTSQFTDETLTGQRDEERFARTLDSNESGQFGEDDSAEEMLDEMFKSHSQGETDPDKVSDFENKSQLDNQAAMDKAAADNAERLAFDQDKTLGNDAYRVRDPFNLTDMDNLHTLIEDFRYADLREPAPNSGGLSSEQNRLRGRGNAEGKQKIGRAWNEAEQGRNFDKREAKPGGGEYFPVVSKGAKGEPNFRSLTNRETVSLFDGKLPKEWDAANLEDWQLDVIDIAHDYHNLMLEADDVTSPSYWKSAREYQNNTQPPISKFVRSAKEEKQYAAALKTWKNRRIQTVWIDEKFNVVKGPDDVNAIGQVRQVEQVAWKFDAKARDDYQWQYLTGEPKPGKGAYRPMVVTRTEEEKVVHAFVEEQLLAATAPSTAETAIPFEDATSMVGKAGPRQINSKVEPVMRTLEEFKQTLELKMNDIRDRMLDIVARRDAAVAAKRADDTVGKVLGTKRSKWLTSTSSVDDVNKETLTSLRKLQQRYADLEAVRSSSTLERTWKDVTEQLKYRDPSIELPTGANLEGKNLNVKQTKTLAKEQEIRLLETGQAVTDAEKVVENIRQQIAVSTGPKDSLYRQGVQEDLLAAEEKLAAARRAHIRMQESGGLALEDQPQLQIKAEKGFQSDTAVAEAVKLANGDPGVLEDTLAKAKTLLADKEKKLDWFINLKRQGKPVKDLDIRQVEAAIANIRGGIDTTEKALEIVKNPEAAASSKVRPPSIDTGPRTAEGATESIAMKYGMSVGERNANVVSENTLDAMESGVRTSTTRTDRDSMQAIGRMRPDDTVRFDGNGGKSLELPVEARYKFKYDGQRVKTFDMDTGVQTNESFDEFIGPWSKREGWTPARGKQFFDEWLAARGKPDARGVRAVEGRILINGSKDAPAAAVASSSARTTVKDGRTIISHEGGTMGKAAVHERLTGRKSMGGDQPYTISATGTRQLILNKEEMKMAVADLVPKIKEVLVEHPDLRIVAGGAEGFDEAMVVAAHQAGVPVHLDLPTEGQGNHYWVENSQTKLNRGAQYQKMLDHAESITYTASSPSRQAMFDRNTVMMQRADEVWAMPRPEQGQPGHNPDFKGGGTVHGMEEARLYTGKDPRIIEYPDVSSSKGVATTDTGAVVGREAHGWRTGERVTKPVSATNKAQILEISTKSTSPLGRDLSAMNLKYDGVKVEDIYQGMKRGPNGELLGKGKNPDHFMFPGGIRVEGGNNQQVYDSIYSKAFDEYIKANPGAIAELEKYAAYSDQFVKLNAHPDSASQAKSVADFMAKRAARNNPTPALAKQQEAWIAEQEKYWVNELGRNFDEGFGKTSRAKVVADVLQSAQDVGNLPDNVGEVVADRLMKTGHLEGVASTGGGMKHPETVMSGPDLWPAHTASKDAYGVIPTNVMLRADGTAVMGAGLAKQAADRFPGLEARYGAFLAEAKANGTTTTMVDEASRLVLVATKDDWRNPSSIGQVKTALDELSQLDEKLLIPALGTGKGGVDKATVAAEMASRGIKPSPTLPKGIDPETGAANIDLLLDMTTLGLHRPVRKLAKAFGEFTQKHAPETVMLGPPTPKMAADEYDTILSTLDFGVSPRDPNMSDPFAGETTLADRKIGSLEKQQKNHLRMETKAANKSMAYKAWIKQQLADPNISASEHKLLSERLVEIDAYRARARGKFARATKQRMDRIARLTEVKDIMASGKSASDAARDNPIALKAIEIQKTGLITQNAWDRTYPTSDPRQVFQDMMGLSSEQLDQRFSALTAPMVKAAQDFHGGAALSKQSRKALYGAVDLQQSQRIITHPDIAAVFNSLEKMREPGALTTVLKHYDQFQLWWKGVALSSPGFHARNAMGGIFNNFLANSEPGAVNRFYRQHNKYIKGELSFEDAKKMQVLLRDVGGGQYSHVELGTGAANKFTLNPFSKDFAYLKGNAAVGNKIEFYLRGGLYWDRLEKGLGPNIAHADVVRFHFDYNDLSSFEEKVVKRVVPFYVWSRRNFPLQLEMMMRNPGKYRLYNQTRMSLMDGKDKDKLLHKYITNSLWGSPLPLHIGKEQIFAVPDLPFTRTMSQNMPSFDNFRAKDPKTWFSTLDPYMQQVAGPLRVPIELLANRQFFSGRPRSFDDTSKTQGSDLGGLLKPLQQRVGKTRLDYIIGQAVPYAETIRKLVGSEEKFEDRRATSWMSYMGIPLRANSKADQQMEAMRISKENERRRVEATKNGAMSTSWASIKNGSFGTTDDRPKLDKERTVAEAQAAGKLYRIESMKKRLLAEYPNIANVLKMWGDGSGLVRMKNGDLKKMKLDFSYDGVKVIKVIDGDTIVVDNNGKSETVRLLGVDTGETKHKGIDKPATYWGPEATAYTRSSLKGRYVSLEDDEVKTDIYGRRLSHVSIDGRSFNNRLLKEGYARSLIIPPNSAHNKRMLRKELEAIQAKRGLWAKATFSEVGDTP